MGKNFCNIENKWCKFLKHNGTCVIKNANISSIERCPRLEEIETTRFSELLKEVDFENVFSRLCYWFPTEVKRKESYKNVFENIISMTPQKHNLDDFFIVVEKISENYDEFLNTYGTKLVGVNKGTKYGIEFLPWNEWISMFFTKETLDSLNKEDIVAACLYEMTFFGFEESKIKQTEEKIELNFEELKK